MLTNTHAYNTTYQTKFLFNISFSINDFDDSDICHSVMDVVQEVNLGKYMNLKNRNSYGYDAFTMFSIVLYAFSKFGYASTRQLADLTKSNAFCMWLAQGFHISHQSFHRFIHDDLSMGIEDIFYDINHYLENILVLDTDILTIDGSKFEANANKNTFIWRKNTVRYRMNKWKKAIEDIKKLNRFFKRENIDVRYSTLREPSIEYLIEITERIEAYVKKHKIEFKHGKGQRKPEIQKLYESICEDAIKLWEYALQFDLLDGRNSCSKTDIDATFMHMKYDYYNHTNVFKPGYNVQLGVTDGIIRNVYVSSDANDINTYIPFMKKYYNHYHCYPKITPADAGYGSYDNYCFCKENNIELYMSYPGYYKEQEKRTEKNKFKSHQIKKDDNGDYICPAGHVFELEKETEDSRSLYPKTNKHYSCSHCQECPLKSQCTKSKNGRTLVRNEQLEQFHQEVTQNIKSEEGKKLMNLRRSQSEGTFGDIKYNQGFDRLHRRGNTHVKLEIYLVCIGQNIRKLHHKRFEELKESNQEVIN